MLELYQRAAVALARFRTLIWLALFASVSAFGWAVFNPTGSDSDTRLLASAAATGWLLCLLVIQYFFVEPPELPGAGDGFFTRIKKRLKVFFSWCLALVVTGLSVAIIMFSARAVSLIIAKLSA